jgi:hypothetical protein
MRQAASVQNRRICHKENSRQGLQRMGEAKEENKMVRLTRPSWSWPLKLPKHTHAYNLVWPQRNLHRRILDRKLL